MTQTREQKYAYTRAWRVRNAEHLRDYGKRFREANHEAVLERAAKWRRENPDKQRAAKARWEANHPEKRVAYESARRARKRKISDIGQVHPLVLLEIDDGTCGICGEDVDPTDYHMDHVVPLARGGPHTYDNMQVAHPLCNMQKGDRIALH